MNSNNMLLLVCCIVLVFASGCVEGLRPTSFVKFNNQSFYVHGINVPWFGGSYGHDIGNNAINHYGVWYNSAAVEAIFQDVASMGFNVMRIWLHEGLEGLLFDNNHMIVGLDPLFMKNLDNLITIAEKHNLYIYAMIIDDGISANNPIITNAQAQSAFFKNALIPLITTFRGRKGIFGIDLFNEIESQIAGNHGNWGDKGCTWDQARAFMTACVKTIKSVDPSRLVSCSSGWHGFENVQSGLFSGLGFDFYDYHSYSTDGKLPPSGSVKSDLPVIVGECGQSGSNRDDNLQTNVDVAYMTNAVLNGYAGSMVWAYGEASDSDPFSFINGDGSHRPVFNAMTKFNGELEL